MARRKPHFWMLWGQIPGRMADLRRVGSRVLERFYEAAKFYKADVIVRITADCPLADPEIIDSQILEFIRAKDLDYLANALPLTIKTQVRYLINTRHYLHLLDLLFRFGVSFIFYWGPML